MAEHVSYHASGGHDHIHDVRCQRELGNTQFIEQIFGAVAQLNQLIDIEESGPALDGVKAAKNVVEQGFVPWPFFQFNQLVVHVGQQLACFRQKIMEQFLHSGEVTHGFSRVALLMS